MVVSHSLEFDFIQGQTLCFAADAACTVRTMKLLHNSMTLLLTGRMDPQQTRQKRPHSGVSLQVTLRSSVWGHACEELV